MKHLNCNLERKLTNLESLHVQDLAKIVSAMFSRKLFRVDVEAHKVNKTDIHRLSFVFDATDAALTVGNSGALKNG